MQPGTLVLILILFVVARLSVYFFRRKTKALLSAQKHYREALQSVDKGAAEATGQRHYRLPNEKVKLVDKQAIARDLSKMKKTGRKKTSAVVGAIALP